jgi:hypothetical protein
VLKLRVEKSRENHEVLINHVIRNPYISKIITIKNKDYRTQKQTYATQKELDR